MYLKLTYHHSDSLTVAHKVHISLPAISLHNLSSRTGVVHGVSRHQILTVRRPGKTQDMGGPATLRNKERENDYLFFERVHLTNLFGEHAHEKTGQMKLSITPQQDLLPPNHLTHHCFCTSLKGLVMLASICQSTVLHTLRLWSSAWEAMYFPTGSHVRPLTKPVCPRRHITISAEKQRRHG